MKDYEVMVWVILEIMELIMLFWVGKYNHKYVYFTYICLYFVVHSSPYLCVCGDDRISCYPGVDDVTGGPGDA